MNNILSLDFDILKYEILLVDGASDDGTKEIILNYIKDNQSIKYIENLDGFVSQAMNLGIKYAKGKIIFRLDVHAIYPNNYILKLHHYLELLNAKLNMVIPSRTHKEYVETNKEKITEYKKQYYKDNKEKIKKTIKNM